MSDPFMDAGDFWPPDVPYRKNAEIEDDPHALLPGWYIYLHGEECGPFDTEEEADAAYEGGR